MKGIGIQRICVRIYNALHVLLIKVKYGNRVKISFNQRMNLKVSLQVLGCGTLCMADSLSNRGYLQIVVMDGILKIGKGCFFNSNCSVTCLARVVIGDNCCFGNNVVVVDHDHDTGSGAGGFITSEVIIGDNVWVGANSVILRGSRIGDNCVIAAGSIVRGEVKSNKLFYQKRESMTKDIGSTTTAASRSTGSTC